MEYYSCLIGGIGLPDFGRGGRLDFGVEATGQHCRHGFAVCRASGRLGQIVLGGRAGGHFDGEPDFVLVPPCVAVISYLDVIANDWFSILTATIASTVCVLLVTGKVHEWVRRLM